MAKLFQKLFAKQERVDLEKLADQAQLSFEKCRLDADLYLSMLNADKDNFEDYQQYLRNTLALHSYEETDLNDEIRNLISYVDFYKSSTKELIYCKVEDKTTFEKAIIYPFILFPLIMNALRQGYNTMEKYPIRIRLRTVGSTLRLEVSNRVNHHLANQELSDEIRFFKSRLEVFYPERFDLLFNSNSNLFKATLLLKLDR